MPFVKYVGDYKATTRSINKHDNTLVKGDILEVSYKEYMRIYGSFHRHDFEFLSHKEYQRGQMFFLVSPKDDARINVFDFDKVEVKIQPVKAGEKVLITDALYKMLTVNGGKYKYNMSVMMDGVEGNIIDDSNRYNEAVEAVKALKASKKKEIKEEPKKEEKVESKKVEEPKKEKILVNNEDTKKEIKEEPKKEIKKPTVKKPTKRRTRKASTTK